MISRVKKFRLITMKQKSYIQWYSMIVLIDKSDLVQKLMDNLQYSFDQKTPL